MFLEYADVAFENNLAERQIRPAVILRKPLQRADLLFPNAGSADG